jgi:hypothetical protein
MALRSMAAGGVEYLGEELEGVGATAVDAGPGGRHFVGASSSRQG